MRLDVRVDVRVDVRECHALSEYAGVKPRPITPRAGATSPATKGRRAVSKREIAAKLRQIARDAHEPVDTGRALRFLAAELEAEPEGRVLPGVGTFRKRAVLISAIRTESQEVIHTLEGDMIAEPGDRIITGIRGERYPCKPDMFAATYEPADTPAGPTLAELVTPEWAKDTLGVLCQARCCLRHGELRTDYASTLPCWDRNYIPGEEPAEPPAAVKLCHALWQRGKVGGKRETD